MINIEDRKLLRVGDTIYSWRSYRQGNTTLTARSVYKTVITRIDDDGRIWGSWNGNRESRLGDWRRCYLHHPKPHHSAYRWDRGNYDDDVKHAAEEAAASRAEWRERRKAVKP